ncbi:SUMF1/EgtB/PvdO family nonheme iron enzyme [Candidatus Nitrospira neomarina]|uniref:SUMF1/EgtB/PvdO family nonheme iron enzyme n=1 Tax=Candidatus Nitrospira neomarina TaxID=3020899 RepID=A0AA96GGD9_9BACT|nr:SUMF1/EgtB/PvdO family nonheme iron enzyme [Candidatus Nitrospira neomarina]WNM60482.1 SUMF1/EgtB/PvdO family nonheme iron enzyme [Candidatus Nitrospira neomarina]
MLDRVPEQAIVLLGPPGSGKSTLLRHFELDGARAVLDGTAEHFITSAPLTFFIQLNDYKADSPHDPMPDPKDWLADRWAAQWPKLPPLDTLLREQRLTLLLDALNEMPYPGPEPVQRWKDYLRHLAQEHSETRVVFSCRSLDYSASLSSNEFPVPQVRIESLSDEQVQSFLEVYCPAHHQTLWDNLRNSPQLDLLRLPYYLKLLIDQTATGEIPAGRAALFTGFVRQALKREVDGDNPLFQPGRLLDHRDLRQLTLASAGKQPFALPERGPLVPQLSQLAFSMQHRQPVQQEVPHQQAGRESGQVRVSYDEAVAAIDHPAAEDILNAGGALGMLEEDLGRLGQNEILFIHQLVQEYFAARKLAHEPNPELVAQEWRQDRVMPNLADTITRLAGSDPLPLLPTSGWEETTILASAMAEQPDRFLTDMMAHHLPLAGRCAAQGEGTVSDQLKTTLRLALVERIQDPEADLRARIEAGLTLGELGVPRFEWEEGPEGPYWLPPLIEIPGGRYTIGSDEGKEEDEKPAHEIELEPFLMGQFPVTNAEWALFVKAGGYDDERWWETDQAKAWRRGETTAEGPKEDWRSWRKRFHTNPEKIRERMNQGRMTSKMAEQWEKFVRMNDKQFEAALEECWPAGRQTKPAYWTDANFNNSQQPVVGICWHEARAYCAWLSAQINVGYRLPTEAEWEAAARGFPRRRFAYGDEFDAVRCNSFETHIRRTTPIGVFPGGRTPEGLMDMTGNVWEWTSSLYQPYPYQYPDGREVPVTGAGRRVLRGGSWYDNQNLMHATYRGKSRPDGRYNLIGFRVVRSSPIFS